MGAHDPEPMHSLHDFIVHCASTRVDYDEASVMSTGQVTVSIWLVGVSSVDGVCVL